MINAFAFDIYDTSDTANSNMKVKKTNCGGKNFPPEQLMHNLQEHICDNFIITLNQEFKDLKT